MQPTRGVLSVARYASRGVGVTAASFLLYSCGSTSTSSLNGPSPAKCQVSVSAGNMSFPPQGGNGSVQIQANRDCSWSAQATAGWIHLGAEGGQGPAVLPFSVDANPQQSSRNGAIEVSSAGQVPVTQAAQPPPPPPAAPPPAPPSDPGPSPGPGPSPPGSDQEIELKGEVLLLAGSCPDLGFVVSGRLVRTNADTEFKGFRCSDIRNGKSVKVKGVVRNDGIVIATEVRKD